MTSKLTREQLRERAQLKAKNLASAISQSAFASCRSELEEELQFLQCALACMEDEPVEPIWGAKKYPVCRPVPGAKLIVWDETGKFVGYGSSVDTRESGVAIEICVGHRLDSNHDLRWQYALQPVPAMDSKPVAWTDEEELRDVDRCGCGYLFTVNPVTPHADERKIILLYRHAQPVPVELRNYFRAEGLAEVLKDARDYAPLTAAQWETLAKNWHQTFVGLSGEESYCRAALQPAPVVPVVPDGLIAAVNRLLDSDGSRGCYSATQCGDAHDEIERLLAAAQKEVK